MSDDPEAEAREREFQLTVMRKMAEKGNLDEEQRKINTFEEEADEAGASK